MAKINSKSFKITTILLGLFLGSFGLAGAVSTFVTGQGGTGTTTPSGILYGDNGATNHLNTVGIGSNLTFSGGVLSATGGSGGSGTVSTSTVPTIGGVAYWTSNGFPSLLGSVATTTISAGSGISFTGTPGYLIGGTNLTISATGGTTLMATGTPSGTIDGSNVTFTTTNSPLLFFVNGIYQTPVTDYTVAGTGPYTETFVTPPANGSVLTYAYSSLGSGVTLPLSISNGGTASSTALSGILVGNGLSAIKSLAIGTNLTFDGTTLNATGGGSSFSYPFTPTSYGSATSTTIGFLNGILSTASSTFTGTLHTNNQIVATGNSIQFAGYSSSPQLYAGDSTTGLHFDGPGIISWHNGGIQTMLLSSTNNVGIATSSPSGRLSLAGSAGGTIPIFIVSTSTSAFATSTALTISKNGNLHLTGGTGLDIGNGVTPPANGAIISGFLGIGTSTPGSLLSIGGNTTGTNFFDNATTTKSGIGGYNIASGCYAIGGTCLSTGGAVSSVSNSDGTLTISPTTGAVVGSLNLAHSNTWTALQSFANASSTLLSSSYASSTVYYGANLATCNSAANALTWVAGVFGCNTISGSGTVGSGTTGQFPYYAGAGTTLTATSSLFIAANGSIGVGTTTPNTTLDVHGSAYVELQTLSTSTNMTQDFCATSNNAIMGVGSANIAFAWTNANLCPGKSILLSDYAPLTGVIGTTTFSGGSGSGLLIWAGGINPGTTVATGTTDDFCFTSTASTTQYIAASLCGQH